jgi:hypothetical protein
MPYFWRLAGGSTDACGGGMAALTDVKSMLLEPNVLDSSAVCERTSKVFWKWVWVYGADVGRAVELWK